VFLTWANAITIGLVLMYILANIGVVKYYLTESRAPVQPDTARGRAGDRVGRRRRGGLEVVLLAVYPQRAGDIQASRHRALQRCQDLQWIT
jgi:hypothetical protein